MNKTNRNLLRVLTTGTSFVAISSLINTLPAQALTWTVNATFPVSETIIGSFILDDEAAAPPTLTAASLTASTGETFGFGDFVGFSPGVPAGNDITALDFDNGVDALSLVFTSPLTIGGGSRTLAVTSDFNGNQVSGSASGSASGGGSTSSVPFDFSSTPGLIAMGLIFGGNHAYKKWKSTSNDKQNA